MTLPYLCYAEQMDKNKNENNGQLRLLAVPFSVEDVLKFEEFGRMNRGRVDLSIKPLICQGPLLEELLNPQVTSSPAPGVLISHHESRRGETLVSAIRILADRDKSLYSLEKGARQILNNAELPPGGCDRPAGQD